MKYSGISYINGIVFFGSNYLAIVTKNNTSIKRNLFNRMYLFGFLLIIDLITVVWSYHTTGTIQNAGIMSIANDAPIDWIIILDITIYGIWGYVILKYGGIVRKNHGAEHKVIAAMENNDLDNSKSYSRIHDRCGTNLMPLYFLFTGLTNFNFIGIPLIVAYILFSKVDMIRYMSVKVGRQLQRITTKEPDDVTLSMAMNGMRSLIKVDRGI